MAQGGDSTARRWRRWRSGPPGRVDLALIGAFVRLGAKTEEQNLARKQMIVELAEANQRLEEMVAENTGLRPSCLPRPGEAGAGDERQRMAREIHDTLAQGLTGIITQLEAAQQTGIEAERERRIDNASGWPATAWPRPAVRSRRCGRRRWKTAGCPRRWPRR